MEARSDYRFECVGHYFENFLVFSKPLAHIYKKDVCNIYLKSSIKNFVPILKVQSFSLQSRISRNCPTDARRTVISLIVHDIMK